MSINNIKMMEMHYSVGTAPDKSLPLVLAVLGDFSCSQNQIVSTVRNGAIKVNQANFNTVLKKLNPKLQLNIEWIFDDGISDETPLSLSFNTFVDFEPLNLLDSFPLLKNKLSLREKLIEVITNNISINNSSIGNTEFDNKVISEVLQAFTVKPQIYNSDIKLSLPLENVPLTTWLNNTLKQIDRLISRQLNKLLHHQKFINLEGSWRGLNHLVSAAGNNNNCIIKLLDVTKEDILNDIKNAKNIHDSKIFSHLDNKSLLTNNMEPLSAIIGDFKFSHSDNDVELLTKIAQFSSSLCCPFISSVSASIFGVNDFDELNHTLDLNKIFSASDYRNFKTLTAQEHSRFISLLLPQVQSRARYSNTATNDNSYLYQEVTPEKAHAFNEFVLPRPLMNSAYVMAAVICNSFISTSSPHFIQGLENGGKTTHLNTATGQLECGDLYAESIANLTINDRRENELSKLGFLPLVDCKNGEHGGFVSSTTIYQPEQSDDEELNNDLSIISKLSFVLLTSRIASYLKVMSYEMLQQQIDFITIEQNLNNWLAKYSSVNQTQHEESRERFPLQYGQVKIKQTLELDPRCQLEFTFTPWLLISKLVKPAFLVIDLN
jgi:type VI secretion system protein ImpC